MGCFRNKKPGTIYLRLSNSDRVAIVDEEDYFFFALYKGTWRLKWTYDKTCLYVVRCTEKNSIKKTIYLHRLIMQVRGRNNEVHPINQDPLDNKKCNLEVCTKEEHLQKDHASKKPIDDVPF